MVLLAGDVAFVIGALLIATSFGLYALLLSLAVPLHVLTRHDPDRVQIIVGRAVLGLGVGVAAGVCAVCESPLRLVTELLYVTPEFRTAGWPAHQELTTIAPSSQTSPSLLQLATAV